MASSSVPESLSRSKSNPVVSTLNRPTLSLGNEDSNRASNFQPAEALQPPEKSINKIPTFLIWSIFNLLLIPFGIVCCYFSYQVSQRKRQNRYEVAKKWSKRTFILNLTTTLIMAGVIITVVMLRNDYNKRHLAGEGNQNQTTVAYIPWQPGR